MTRLDLNKIMSKYPFEVNYTDRFDSYYYYTGVEYILILKYDIVFKNIEMYKNMTVNEDNYVVFHNDCKTTKFLNCINESDFLDELNKSLKTIKTIKNEIRKNRIINEFK